MVNRPTLKEILSSIYIKKEDLPHSKLERNEHLIVLHFPFDMLREGIWISFSSKISDQQPKHHSSIFWSWTMHIS